MSLCAGAGAGAGAGGPAGSTLAPVLKEPRVPVSNFEIDFASLDFGELIGQGAFGRVYKGCVALACRSPVCMWCAWF